MKVTNWYEEWKILCDCVQRFTIADAPCLDDLLDVISVMEQPPCNSDFSQLFHRDELQWRRPLQQDVSFHTEAEGIFDGLVVPSRERFINESVSKTFASTSLIAHRQFSSTALSTLFWMASAIRTPTSVLNSADCMTVLAPALVWTIQCVLVSDTEGHNVIRPIRPALVQWRWTKRVWGHYSTWNSSLVTQSNVGLTALVIWDCRVSDHLVRWRSTIVPASDFVTTSRSAKVSWILFPMHDGCLTTYSKRGCGL